MGLSTQLHIAAGVGALFLGAGVLLREPRRGRNRLFSALCVSVAVWNLGVAAASLDLGDDVPWRLIFRLGSCAAAPLGLHFVMVITASPVRGRRTLLAVAYGAAAILWLTNFVTDNNPRWNLAALFVLGAILLTAIAILTRYVSRLMPGPHRRAIRFLLVGSALAVLGGLSDFIPRGDTQIFRVGPVFMLAFLLIVSSVVVRRRFLDVDVFLARAVALMAGAVGAALVLLGVIRLFGVRFLPLFIASLVLFATMRPLVRFLFMTTRGLFGGEEQLAKALVATSQELSLAQKPDDVWEAIEDGRRALPGDVHLVVYLARDDGAFAATYAAGFEPMPSDVPPGSGLELLLAEERAPIARRFLEVESREAGGSRRAAAREALGQTHTLDGEMIVPLLSGSRLLGWIAVGGGNPERYLRSQVAAAFMAVGHQAVASLERIAAQEEARRRETLAAVGEMAAGLAHEVRNPVAAIRGAAQAIAPEATPEQAREMLDVIEEETARLGRVVGEFLDYARPSSPRRDEVNAGELAKRVARGAELAGIGLRVEVDVAADAPVMTGDPDQIHRAFENLVRNAAEATGGEGSLQIRVTRGARGGVEIHFEDDGPGIPDEVVTRVFEPFQTTKTSGTGLGLALVQRIVESHRGTICVESRPGEGAAFTLEFPAPDG